MKNKKISFIVPVYKVEEYLERCIESILNQKNIQFEIILVNDGSPDNSQKIIDRYAKKDKRIISIKKENEGVSIARNTGLDAATGDYILFIDSDDYIEEDYAEYFVNLLEKDHADMAMSLNYFDDCNNLPPSSDKYDLLSGEQATIDLYLEKTGVAVWNKIYRKEFLDKNNIRFNPEFWFAEGMTFNIECFQHSKEIAVGMKKVYHQTYNPNSAVRKFNIDSWYCGMKAMEYQKSLWKTRNKRVLDAWNYHYHQYYFNILRGICMSNSEQKYKEEKQKCIKQLHKNSIYPFRVNIPFKRKIKWLLIAIFPMAMIKHSIQKELIQSKKNY